MRSGRPKTALVLSDEQREQLQGWARSRSLPSGLVNRVRIVLLAGEGIGNKPIAARLGLSQPTVGKWAPAVPGTGAGRPPRRVAPGPSAFHLG